MILNENGKIIEKQQEAFTNPGVYAVVGAGGKTTLCFSTARELWQAGKKVVVTTTTHMWQEEGFLPESQRELVLTALDQNGYVFTGGNVQDGKVTAISEEFLEELKEAADYIFVEADGSAGYPLKAPAGHEPAVPVCADYLVVVGSMSALGKPIKEVCHRQEQVCKLSGTSQDAIVTPERMAAILWKGYGERTNLPTWFVISRSEEREKEATEVAGYLRERKRHGKGSETSGND